MARVVTRTARLSLRATSEEKAIVRQGAVLCGMTLSEFIVDSARRQAEAIVAAHEAVPSTTTDER